ncbi:hypothetical protein [uncultured Acinetobacter sp.]|uniref:hypothetical protein n=1 Tax=uncultured Acinetobacter sp. TaxID=165433 RepID=UPI0037498F43
MPGRSFEHPNKLAPAPWVTPSANPGYLPLATYRYGTAFTAASYVVCGRAKRYPGQRALWPPGWRTVH